MDGTTFASLIREYTRTNSTSLPDATIVLLANTVKDDFAAEIIKADENIFGVVATNNLRASDADDITQREYKLPQDNLKVIKVEAMPDGESWLPFEKFDLSIYKKPTTDPQVTEQFANVEGSAFWHKFRNAIWLFCGAITATNNALEIHYIAYPADITTDDLSGSTDLSEDPTNTTSQLPRQFHELWARKVSIMWKSNRSKPIPLSERELQFEVDFQKKMDSIENIDEATLEGTIPDDTDIQY